VKAAYMSNVQNLPHRQAQLRIHWYVWWGSSWIQNSFNIWTMRTAINECNRYELGEKILLAGQSLGLTLYLRSIALLMSWWD
jgi:hypothetical protein